MITLVDILLVTLAAFATIAGYRRGLPALVGVVAISLVVCGLALLNINPWLYLILALLLSTAIAIATDRYVARLASGQLDSGLGALGGLLAGVFLLLVVYGGAQVGSLPEGLANTIESSPLSEPLGSVANQNEIFARLLGQAESD